ncbi:MAG: radical SAM protein [bacterium]|nr:radical SAM protein [bacterium]
MDILFINPPWHKESGNIWKNVSSCMPPFGLALLASLVREKNYSASILDCNALQLGLDKVKDNLPESPPRFVGLTATTVLAENALVIAKIVQEKYPEAKVIMGGVHATLLPEEVLGNPAVDFIVMGEGEYSFLDLIAGLDPGNIKGLGFKKDGQIILNQPREIIPDINVFPMLAYDLLPMDRYYAASGSYKRKPSFGIITSRGCPGRCTFCKGDILGQAIRFRSAENIFNEIVYLQKNYGIRDITFYDDTFTANKKNVSDFCDLILGNKINLTWCCFSRVDTVNYELLVKMKKAGCYQVMYGIESADPQIIKNINKRITFEKAEETVAATKKAGLETRLAFMFGNPGETEETIKKTIKYAIHLNPDLVSFNITTPYPGTEMYKWADQNNYLIHKNWSEYNLAKPVMELPTISAAKVLEYYKRAYRQFYLRPSFIFKRLSKIRSFDDFKRNFLPFISLLKFNFGK